MKRFDQHVLPLSISLAPPSTRTLAVVVYAWRDDATGELRTETEVHPVVSIQAAVTTEYSRRARPGQFDRPSTPDEAKLTGWAYESTNITYDAIVWDDERDALVTAREAFGASNGVYRIVSAPWDPAEDTDRLALIVAKLVKDACAKVDAERRSEPRIPAAEPLSAAR